MKKQILLAIVLVVLAAVIAYGGWRVWYPSQEPVEPAPAPGAEEPKATSTATKVPKGWKVYENQLYGYLIRYPEEFRSQASPSDSFATIYGGNVPAIGGPAPKNGIKISISVSPDLAQATVDEWVKTFGPRYQAEGVTTVAGERAIYGKWDVGTDTNPEDDIFVPTGSFGGDVRVIHNGIGYQIAYTPYDSDWKSVFEQMLATFEFTK